MKYNRCAIAYFNGYELIDETYFKTLTWILLPTDSWIELPWQTKIQFESSVNPNNGNGDNHNDGQFND